MSLAYDDVRHDCELPSTDHLPDYGEEHQTVARFKCPECKSRWVYRAEFMANRRFYWTRVTGPSWRWRRKAKRELALREDR